MINFIKNNKAFIIIALITTLVIVGGVFLMSGGKNQTNVPKGNTYSETVLVPEGVYETSGFVDGTYLPATSSAKATLVEFGDYVCPACGVYAPYVKQILTDFPGKMNYVFRNFPLSYHTNAPIASYAALAAGLQGKYWEMHDKLYSTQSVWADLNDPKDTFIGYAKELNLDTEKFVSDMQSKDVKDIVERDSRDGNAVKLTGTPTFFLNGTMLELKGSFEDFKSQIQTGLN